LRGTKVGEQNWPEGLKADLEKKRDELSARLGRIKDNVRRSLDADSEERARELADSEVVDALGNEAREEIRKITAALDRMASGEYGICTRCGTTIAVDRLAAHPYAEECIDCAELDEQVRGGP
jgi:RNA polymerase-binding protein DksA